MASSTRTVNVKFDGSAKGLIAATKDGEREVDRFGKSVDKKFKKSGDDSGKGFHKGLMKWFSPAALSDLKKSGEFGASAFGSGFLGALRTPVLGPAIVAALVAALAVALPIVGSLLAGGLVLAMGGGLAAMGLAVAAKSPVVVKAFTKLKDDIGAQLKLISKPFESTLTEIATMAQGVFKTFTQPLKDSFAEIAPALTVFSGYVGKAIEALAPAIGPVSDAFVAMLDSLGPELPGIAKGISDGIIGIANTIKKNPQTFTDLVKFFGKVVEFGLTIVAVLSTTANGIDKAVRFIIDQLSTVGRAFVLLAQAGVTAFKVLVDAAFDTAESVVSAFAMIPGPQQGAMKKAADAIKDYKKSADKSFDGALDKLNEWDTKLKNAPKIAKFKGDIADLDSKINTAKAQLADPKLTPTKRAKLEAYIGQLLTAKKQAQDAIDALKGKTVTLTVRTVTVGGKKQDQGVGGGGHTPGHASGGLVQPRRQYLVGERGPEILTMGGTGGRITPNEQLGQAETGGDTYVYVAIDGQQLQGRITKTVRDHDRQLKRTVKAG